MSHPINTLIEEQIWEDHLEVCETGTGCDCGPWRGKSCVHDSWEREWCEMDEECMKDIERRLNSIK